MRFAWCLILTATVRCSSASEGKCPGAGASSLRWSRSLRSDPLRTAEPHLIKLAANILLALSAAGRQVCCPRSNRRLDPYDGLFKHYLGFTSLGLVGSF